tara:strand:- start:546 stop:731 length:186 start_codon:yes stop_codon:yes gene_type:complete
MVFNYIYKNLISFFGSTEEKEEDSNSEQKTNGVIENEPINIISETLTPNAMAPLPKNKIIV